MITLNEAAKIIEEVRPEFDMVQEYDDSFIFYKSAKGEAIDDIGGVDMPVLISKADGRWIKQIDNNFYKYANVKVGEPRWIEDILG